MEKWLKDQIEAYDNGELNDQQAIDLMASILNALAIDDIPAAIRPDVQQAIDKGYVWKDDNGVYDSRDLRTLI